MTEVYHCGSHGVFLTWFDFLIEGSDEIVQRRDDRSLTRYVRLNFRLVRRRWWHDTLSLHLSMHHWNKLYSFERIRSLRKQFPCHDYLTTVTN